MDRTFRSGLSLLIGIGLLFAALVLHSILLETVAWTLILSLTGFGFFIVGVISLRSELGSIFRRRRAEIALFTAGLVGIYISIGYFSIVYPLRYDMTEAGLHSLSDQTISMLQRLEQPVHIVFFHSHQMGETVERYALMAKQTDKVTVEFHDPSLNPAQARLHGVRFPGTAIMTSGSKGVPRSPFEGRRHVVDGDSEVDIANGILRVSQGITQLICFLDGHGEADPFSKEMHDHMEGTAGHSHGMGVEYVLHETHGMAKARGSLESLNYKVKKVSLLQEETTLRDCEVLIVAGPKAALLDSELAHIKSFLQTGGNALFMIDPFIETGLETVINAYGARLDDGMVVDETNHFGTDSSAPAVTSYNYHQITREVPLTFYPGSRSLSPTDPVPGVQVTPVVNSSRLSFSETTRDRIAFDRGIDLPGPRTLMLAANRRPLDENDAQLLKDLARSPEQQYRAEDINAVTEHSRVIIVGDSDFATNSFFHVLGNGRLFLNAVSYLAAQENLIGIKPALRELPRFNLTNRQMKGTFFVALFLVPSLLFLIGTAVWWRQR
jgi:ABC-type uncharacterized transport system involved in gliding motility auxiliary subunit